jgi:hypothetical protein
VLQSRVSRSAAPFDASVAQLRTHFDLLQDHGELPAPVRLPSRPAPRREPSAGDWKSW